MPTKAQSRAHLATLVAVLLDQPQVQTPYGIGTLTMISAEPGQDYPAGIVYVRFGADVKPRHRFTERLFRPEKVTLLSRPL